MKVKNKRTQEKLEISYFDFRKKFAKEIQISIDSYSKTQLNKYFYKIIYDNSIEQDFYFNLQWNFNNFGNSNWYIERM